MMRSAQLRDGRGGAPMGMPPMGNPSMSAGPAASSKPESAALRQVRAKELEVRQLIEEMKMAKCAALPVSRAFAPRAFTAPRSVRAHDDPRRTQSCMFKGYVHTVRCPATAMRKPRAT